MVSANYQKDVESAEMITTQPSSTPQCGTGTQLLGLEWNQQGTVYENIVSYVKVNNGSTSSLVRQYCTNGSTTPTSTSTVSSDILQSQTQSAPVVITPASINASAGGRVDVDGWYHRRYLCDDGAGEWVLVHVDGSPRGHHDRGLTSRCSFHDLWLRHTGDGHLRVNLVFRGLLSL